MVWGGCFSPVARSTFQVSAIILYSFREFKSLEQVANKNTKWPFLPLESYSRMVVPIDGKCLLFQTGVVETSFTLGITLRIYGNHEPTLSLQEFWGVTITMGIEHYLPPKFHGCTAATAYN